MSETNTYPVELSFEDVTVEQLMWIINQSSDRQVPANVIIQDLLEDYMKQRDENIGSVE